MRVVYQSKPTGLVIPVVIDTPHCTPTLRWADGHAFCVGKDLRYLEAVLKEGLSFRSPAGLELRIRQELIGGLLEKGALQVEAEPGRQWAPSPPPEGDIDDCTFDTAGLTGPVPEPSPSRRAFLDVLKKEFLPRFDEAVHQPILPPLKRTMGGSRTLTAAMRDADEIARLRRELAETRATVEAMRRDEPVFSLQFDEQWGDDL